MNKFFRELSARLLAGLIGFGTFLTIISAPVSAQMNIDISGVGQSLFPIAVMRFAGENQLPAKVTDVVRSDLTRSGAMRNVESGAAEMAWGGEDATFPEKLILVTSPGAGFTLPSRVTFVKLIVPIFGLLGDAEVTLAT